jgi:hypothetical protein
VSVSEKLEFTPDTKWLINTAYAVELN